MPGASVQAHGQHQASPAGLQGQGVIGRQCLQKHGPGLPRKKSNVPGPAVDVRTTAGSSPGSTDPSSW